MLVSVDSMPDATVMTEGYKIINICCFVGPQQKHATSTKSPKTRDPLLLSHDS